MRDRVFKEDEEQSIDIHEIKVSAIPFITSKNRWTKEVSRVIIILLSVFFNALKIMLTYYFSGCVEIMISSHKHKFSTFGSKRPEC